MELLGQNMKREKFEKERKNRDLIGE